jgi:WD40 repeat protein
MSVAFSPDGKQIVSGSHDKTIRLWNAELGEMIGQPLRGHSDEVNSVAFSPDGKRIISGSADDTIRLWDVGLGEATGEPLRGHSDTVISVSFSPDGRRIVSSSTDKTIRLWDAGLGEGIGEPLRGHSGLVFSVAFSPDGKRIVSASIDETIRFWAAESKRAMFSSSSTISEDGWMTTYGGELLFWVPAINRNGFVWPTQSIIGANPTRISFHKFACGSEWTNVKSKSE